MLSGFKTLNEGVKVLDQLGVLERLFLKLASHPDKAAGKLTAALAELAAGYTALHNEMVFLGTISVADEDLPELKRRLTALGDGRLAAELRSSKGSCGKIWNLYQRYLQGWFSKAFNKAEAKELEAVFLEFSHMDGKFILAAQALSDDAKRLATRLLALLHKKDTEAAQALIDASEQELAPLREQLSNHMKKLWDLQSRFIQISGAL
jgi:hypothetical protein